VDGVDECSVSGDIPTALSGLVVANTKVLVTSSTNRDIAESFCKQAQLTMDDNLIQADIAVVYRLALD
jgi:phosphohistidine swiveling domain-containing protein